MANKYFRSVEGIQKHPLFKHLTDKQQKFLVTFLTSNGNKVESAKAAYNSKNENAAKVMAAKTLNNPKVRSLLSIYDDYEESVGTLDKKQLLEILSSRIRGSKGNESSFVKLVELFVDMQGWGKDKRKPQPEPETDNDLFSLVKQIEQGQSQ